MAMQIALLPGSPERWFQVTQVCAAESWPAVISSNHKMKSFKTFLFMLYPLAIFSRKDDFLFITVKKRITGSAARSISRVAFLLTGGQRYSAASG